MTELTERVAICWTCCGPTYRETLLKKLQNYCTDSDNVFYFIITDDKTFFKDVNRKNLIVNELKDFYNDFPLLQKYESYLESDDSQDYAKKFTTQNYRFPFSTNRFHLIQIEDFNITNVVMLCTDTDVFIDKIKNYLPNKNHLYNAVSRWYQDTTEQNMAIICDILYEDFGLQCDQNVQIFDGAAKFFIFDNKITIKRFFSVWNHVIQKLYEHNKMRFFWGSYAVNDEYILAPIYNVFGIHQSNEKFSYAELFEVNHDPAERFWSYW